MTTRRSRNLHTILLAAAVVVFTTLPLLLQFYTVARAGYAMGDYRAFYCASRVAASGENPYLRGPLHACEVALGPRAFYSTHGAVTVPAPLPGYVFAALRPLAMLPFAASAIVWGALLLAACGIAAFALVRLTNFTWVTPLAALSLSLIAESVPYGEVVPIAVAALCVAALFAKRGQWVAAALAAVASMIEPHLGLPACIALFLWAPRTRLTLVAGAIALAAASLFQLGPHVNVDYFAVVLPAHVLSEATRDTQYSLTAVLASLGFPDALAVRAGALSYAVMAVLGCVLARALAQLRRESAFLVLTPPVAVLVGGTFLHVTQMAAAIPLALLLLRDATARRRIVSGIALLLLSVPWMSAGSLMVATAMIVPIALLAWELWPENVRAVTICAVLAGALVSGLALAYAHHHASAAATPTATSTIDPRLAEADWATFTRRYSSSGALATWFARLPTWIALLLLLSVAADECRAGASRFRAGGVVLRPS